MAIARGRQRNGRGSVRLKLEQLRQRHDAAQREAITATGDLRRAQVYRTDVEFTGIEADNPLPRDPAERARLVAEVTRLRAQDFTFLRIAEVTGYDLNQIGYLVGRHKIKGGKRDDTA